VTDRRLVVVLGMHRSGTSAVARALAVMGVDLGNNLIAGVSGNNDKGFFEDRDFAFFNDNELLPALGLRWHSLDALDEADFERPAVRALEGRALALLQAKFSTSGAFGLKDPRLSRLLPFWRRIFARLGLDVAHVLVYRHPLSVAQSLLVRDGFDPVKSCLLWFFHMQEAIAATRDAPRVFVSYDRLMDDAPAQLRRMAAALGLPWDAQVMAEAERYAREFLDNRLRHGRHVLDDTAADPAVIAPVTRAARLLDDLASDAIDAASDAFSAQWAAVCEDLARHGPLLRLAAALDRKAQLAEEEKSRLEKNLAERERDLAELKQTISLRDWQISGLGHTVSERDERIRGLHHNLAEMHKTVALRDHQIFALGSTIAERDATIHGLQEALSQAREAVLERERRLDALFSSTSWRLTTPIRLIGRLLRAAKG